MTLTPERWQTLAHNPWFASLPQVVQRVLLEAAEPLKLRAGEMLFRQGDGLPTEGAVFFGVLSGHLKFSNLHEDGREAILAVLEPGNWFGEISLFDGQPRTHDATALAATEVLAISRQAFDALLRQTEFAQGICRLMAVRLRLLYGMLEDASLQSTRVRVARRLLLLTHGGATHQTQARAEVAVSQESLAMMLGITRQTLSKELKALVAAGALTLRYGRIEVCSTAALQREAQALP